MSVPLHISGGVRYMIVTFGTNICSNFFHFFKILIFPVFKGDVKGQKMTITNFILSHSISQEPQIILSRFLVHRCNAMIPPGVFLTFFIGPLQQFFNKQLFFKSINKCQTEILRCAPPSSRRCDFLIDVEPMQIQLQLKFLIEQMRLCHFAHIVQQSLATSFPSRSQLNFVLNSFPHFNTVLWLAFLSLPCLLSDAILNIYMY